MKVRIQKMISGLMIGYVGYYITKLGWWASGYGLLGTALVLLIGIIIILLALCVLCESITPKRWWLPSEGINEKGR